ncbi:MAG: hypothetical protein KatS3mg066_1849 [Fischerella sp.]|nr:MAG: hypothetical protein KatS3mg066_1849 [Fischerella sp.]
METLSYFLPQVWFGILALFLFLYVMLDGFDLGVGILSLTASTEERRSILMTSLSNIWDANETWLVLMGGGLFGAFPLAYGTILNALYIPILLMVFGLIFRAVAFEFREQAKRKLFWNFAFGAGSFLAALGQGFALGGVLKGIQVDQAGSLYRYDLGLVELADCAGSFDSHPRLCPDWFHLFNLENHRRITGYPLQNSKNCGCDNFDWSHFDYNWYSNILRLRQRTFVSSPAGLPICCDSLVGSFVDFAID